VITNDSKTITNNIDLKSNELPTAKNKEEVSKNYNYKKAFSRNLGWFRPEDQKRISQIRIAIPGLGGVGGVHLYNFLRLGFCKFNLADPDSFEIGNFNRQVGATCENIGRSKAQVAAEEAAQINPNSEIKLFKGVTLENMAEFLTDVDIVVDGLDLFAMDIRIPLFELAHKMGIPVVTAGPFGMGTSILAFSPDKMSYNDYFDLNHKGLTLEAKIIRFLAGICPNMMHRKYLRNPNAVDLFNGKLPSLNIGCMAASAAVGATVTKIVLDRKDKSIRWAPHGFHVDFNLHKSIRFWRPFGNRNPIQFFKIKAYLKFFNKKEYL
jgi:molybdopterin/thiamine biosynthesis adenylyltransferase